MQEGEKHPDSATPRSGGERSDEGNRGTLTKTHKKRELKYSDKLTSKRKEKSTSKGKSKHNKRDRHCRNGKYRSKRDKRHHRDR